MTEKTIKNTEQLLKLAEDLLLDEKDFIVPVKKIWLKLSLMGEAETLAFEEFAIMLQQDGRFEVFDDTDDPQVDKLFGNHRSEWEELGYYFGPRVMLKDRKPSRKEIGQTLIQKTQQIFENLKKAWDLRPQDDEEEEDQLLQALASTQKLLRTLQKEFPDSSKKI
ncbi:hypothetical protein JW960_29195 [candidate division KSB1 bacterium]|nr:hypothetical protein [candidate division KSB1 bacterium]